MLWLALVANVIIWLTHSYLQKYLTLHADPLFIARRMFAVAVSAGLIIHLFVWRTVQFHSLAGIIALIGAVNAIAAWFFIRGAKVSLAKTSLFSPLTTVISLILSVVFFQEWNFIDPRETPGLLILMGTFFSVGALLLLNYPADKQADLTKNHSSSRWLWFVLTAIILWGVTNFLLKVFSVQAVPMTVFLLWWYAGAWSGLTIISSLAKMVWPQSSDERIVPRALPGRIQLLTLVTGILIIASLASFYYLVSLGPGVLIFQLHDVATIAGAVLTGLFIFKENRHLDRLGWWGLACGAGGVVLLTIGSVLTPG